MDRTFDLESKPLTRALIAFAVRSMDPAATAQAPTTHHGWLQIGVTRTASAITDKALLLSGRTGIASSDVLPADAPVVIGFSLFLMLGITQLVGKEGISLDVKELTELLIAQQLDQKIRMAADDQAVKNEILEISRVATQIPGQIVETAQGEVEELFRKCYAVIPGFIQGDDEARGQLVPIFGTALHLLLRSQVNPE